MSLLAPALATLPPVGLGCYVRDSIEEGIPWSFLAVSAWRSDRDAQVERGRELGVRNFILYGTPERFQPDTWRAGLDKLASEAQRMGIPHVLPDPETVWPDISSARRTSEATAFGRRCVELSGSMRVGVTSYPRWPALRPFAEAAAGHVWVSPQIYGRSAMDAQVFREWFDAWAEPFGVNAVASSIAGWPASTSMVNADGFRRYLSLLPPSAGQIVWDAAGRMPAYIRDALAAHSPGGSSVGTAALALRQVLTSKAFAVLATLAVVCIVVAVAVSARGK